MTPFIRLRTVPHTGTRFMMELLSRHLLNYNGRHYGKDKVGIVGDLVLTTLRHPVSCYETYVRCGNKIDEYYRAWHELNEAHYIEKDMWFIPVDIVHLRDRMLKQFGDRVGVELQTDWKPKGHTERYFPAPIIPEDRVYTEIMELPMVRQFYCTQDLVKEYVRNNGEF